MMVMSSSVTVPSNWMKATAATFTPAEQCEMLAFDYSELTDFSEAITGPVKHAPARCACFMEIHPNVGGRHR